jgi:hypothetical protein
MGAQTGPDKGGTDEGNGALTSGADKRAQGCGRACARDGVGMSMHEGWSGNGRERGWCGDERR